MNEKPLIFDYAIPRISKSQVIYEYDRTLNLNIIKNKNKIIPFVDSTIDDIELLTKTFVDREKDDDENNSIFLAEITKTPVKPEQDDEEEMNIYNYLELLTKTEVRRESDDQ